MTEVSPLPCIQRSNRSILFQNSFLREFRTLPVSMVRINDRFDSIRAADSALESKLLALAIKRAGVDAQDAGGVFTARAALEQQSDVLGLELFEADRQSDLD